MAPDIDARKSPYQIAGVKSMHLRFPKVTKITWFNNFSLLIKLPNNTNNI